MTNTALSAPETGTKGESRAVVQAVAKPVPANPPKARAKRTRAKKPAPATALAKTTPSSAQQTKTQYGTLLVGAGIGAAVTLSVVAFGTKRGRSAALAMAVTKSVSYALARTTENGSMLNLLARAVSSAIA